jgi:hypothetical protein
MYRTSADVFVIVLRGSWAVSADLCGVQGELEAVFRGQRKAFARHLGPRGRT